MKRFLSSTTAWSLSFMLVLPQGVAAQDLNGCRLDGSERLFPCLAGGEVIRSFDEMQSFLAGRGLGGQKPAEDPEGQAARDAAAEYQARQKEQRAAAQAQERAAREAAEREAARQAAERKAARQAAADYRARQKEQRAAAQAQERAAREAAERAAARQAEAEYRARQKQRQAAAQAQERAAREAAERARNRGAIEMEQITRDMVRSSDEEFDTAVTGDRGGLSKFEKALVLGLGAVVVGSVLKNGDKILSRSGDRVVVESPNGGLRVLKDDDALLRRPGDRVETQTFDDGSSRSIVTKPDGARVVTIRGRDGTVLRRVNVDARGNAVVLIDDLEREQEVVVSRLPQLRQSTAQAGAGSDEALRAALLAQQLGGTDRRFSLRQVREIQQVRALVPELELDAVRFRTGSAAIEPAQARSLTRLGTALRRLVIEDPRTVILVEGHTDAVGGAGYNLALSDRRAETVALALTEYFGVPPENMVTQGYGEAALKVPTLAAEPANRRAVVRNITALLR